MTLTGTGWWGIKGAGYSPFSGTGGLCPNSKYDFFLNCLSEEVNTWFYPKLTEGSQETLTLKRLPPLPPTTLKSLYLEKSSLCPFLKNLEFSLNGLRKIFQYPPILLFIIFKPVPISGKLFVSRKMSYKLKLRALPHFFYI